jgi:putative ABC transport system ATP-binding protein
MSPVRGRSTDDRGRAGGTGLAARAERLTKVYGSGDTEVSALRGIDLDFPRGRFTAIMGPSGSGKSTLMHCLAGLDTVSGGRVFIGDVELSQLSDRQLTQLRRDRIGFIFQQFNLLPTLTAAENITLPLDIAGRKADRKWMKLVIDAVGLAPRMNHRPTELSGGQQQRVACARALITRPDIIFGDEPTGNLDSASGAEVLSFLADSVSELGQTVVMVTHDAIAASYADEVVFLADGRVVDMMFDPTADAVLDRMKSLDQAARSLDGRRGTTPPRAGREDGDRPARRVPTGPSGRRTTGPSGTRVPTDGGRGTARGRRPRAVPAGSAGRPAAGSAAAPAARDAGPAGTRRRRRRPASSRGRAGTPAVTRRGGRTARPGAPPSRSRRPAPTRPGRRIPTGATPAAAGASPRPGRTGTTGTGATPAGTATRTAATGRTAAPVTTTMTSTT